MRYVEARKVFHFNVGTLLIDNLKITLQFCGDIQWNHIIYDVNEWRLVSNKGRRILIVSQPIAVYFHQIGGERWIKQN